MNGPLVAMVGPYGTGDFSACVRAAVDQREIERRVVGARVRRFARPPLAVVPFDDGIVAHELPIHETPDDTTHPSLAAIEGFDVTIICEPGPPHAAALAFRLLEDDRRSDVRPSHLAFARLMGSIPDEGRPFVVACGGPNAVADARRAGQIVVGLDTVGGDFLMPREAGLFDWIAAIVTADQVFTNNPTVRAVHEGSRDVRLQATVDRGYDILVESVVGDRALASSKSGVSSDDHWASALRDREQRINSERLAFADHVQQLRWKIDELEGQLSSAASSHPASSPSKRSQRSWPWSRPRR